MSIHRNKEFNIERLWLIFYSGVACFAAMASELDIQ